MDSSRNKLYLFLLIASLVGYVWLYFSFTQNITENKSVGVCLMKHATNVPCPSCGSTRSVLSFIKGDFLQALNYNPIGCIIAVFLIIAPIWVVIDIISNANTLFDFYRKTENYLKQPIVAIPLIFLVIINWIWNVTKGI